MYWLARNKGGRLYLYISDKPPNKIVKFGRFQDSTGKGNHVRIPDNEKFSGISWENSPVKVDITIINL